MAKRHAYIVPTLVAYEWLKRRGPGYGLSAYSLEKNKIVLEAGLRSLELCREAGVKIGFGSDLLGQLQDDQCREFLIRSEIMKPQEIIHSATIVNAEIVQRPGQSARSCPARTRTCSWSTAILQGSRRFPGPGRASVGDHEGRPLLQEPALAPREVGPWCAARDWESGSDA